MTEYIKRDDILDYAYQLRPSRGSYFNTGIAEQMVLDKETEIADELERLPFVEIKDD